MRRWVWPFASMLLVLSACNALTGASDLSTCTSCDEKVDAGSKVDARPPEAGVGDGDVVVTDGAIPIDASTDAPVDAPVEAGIGCQGAVACTRVVFVTSQLFTGDLGGIKGADMKCQQLADVSTVARIKGRTFVAWVSTSTSSVSARLVHGTQPYLRADGAMIASQFTDLVDNTLQNGISIDELGQNHNGAVWTATNSGNGLYTGQSCLDWTSGNVGTRGDRGNVGGNGSGWSVGSSDDCSTPDNLYCFEK